MSLLTPEHVYTAGFRAYRDRDHHALASLADATSAQRLRESVAQQFALPSPTMADLQSSGRRAPWPPEAAAFFASVFRDTAASMRVQCQEAFGVTSEADIAALDLPTLIAGRWAALPRQDSARLSCRVIGSLIDGERAYVLLSIIHPDFPPAQEPGVASLARENEQWRLVLSSTSPHVLPGLSVPFAAAPPASPDSAAG